MEDLRPCPFCGAIQNYESPYYGVCYVICPECGCKTSICTTSGKAAHTWNQRNKRNKPPVEPVEIDLANARMDWSMNTCDGVLEMSITTPLHKDHCRLIDMCSYEVSGKIIVSEK